MINLRRNILRNIFLFWICIFTFFADAVNLDDLFLVSRIIHSDVFMPESSVGTADFHNVYNLTKKASLCPQNHNKSSVQKVSYDEDSPSDAVSLFTADKTAIPFKEKKETAIHAVSLTQSLYKKFCTLLI